MTLNSLKLSSSPILGPDGNRTEFQDYLIDGTRFFTWVGWITGAPEKWNEQGSVTPFFHAKSATERKFLRRVFTGKASSGLPEGRIPLYVCSCCGDFGCGVASVVLTVSLEFVEWSEFSPYENTTLAEVPLLRFERRAYETTLSTV